MLAGRSLETRTRMKTRTPTRRGCLDKPLPVPMSIAMWSWAHYALAQAQAALWRRATLPSALRACAALSLQGLGHWFPCRVGACTCFKGAQPDPRLCLLPPVRHYFSRSRCEVADSELPDPASHPARNAEFGAGVGASTAASSPPSARRGCGTTFCFYHR
jgi:hypothetical protein